MKIQHKRSAALDGSVAKEPTAAQTDLGELCVNFNTADPALFIRDNADNIRRVGGDLSLYQKIEDTPPPVFVCLPDEINAQSPPAERLEGTLWWNTEEGILYVWFEDGDSEQWVIVVPQAGSDSLTEEQADIRYLSKVSDDTAAGAITFEKLTTHEAGVDVVNAVINSDGSATFAGTVTGGEYNQTSDITAGYEFTKNGILKVQRTAAEAQNSVNEVLRVFGGDTQTAAISADGSAEFAGTVVVGPADITSNTANGVRILDSGSITAQRRSTQGSSTLFTGLLGDTATFQVLANGSATFAGDVKIGGTLPSDPNITLKADGSITAASGLIELKASGQVYSNRTISTGACFYGNLNGVNTSAIFADGSATFAGNVKASRGIFRNNNNESVIVGEAALGSVNYSAIQLRTDGSGSFAGGVSFSGATGGIDTSNFGTRIGLRSGGVSSPGLFKTSRDVGSGGDVAVFSGNTGEISLKGDGSAEFAGSMYCGSNLSNSTSAKSVINRNGTITSYKGGASTDIAFAAYNIGKAENTIELVADGSARFAGPTEHADGVKVSGGSTVSDGLALTNSGDTLRVFHKGETCVYADFANRFTVNASTRMYSSDGIGFDIRGEFNNGDGPTANTNFTGYYMQPELQAGNGLANFSGFTARVESDSAGTVSNKCYGFNASGTLQDKGVEGSYGFYSSLNGTGINYNFFAAGTAPNYFAGLTEHAGGVNVTGGDGNYDLRTNTNKSTSTGTYSIMSTPRQEGNTTFLRSFYSAPGVNSGTTDTVAHYYARQGTFGGTVTEQMGFAVDGNLSGAAKNYGFHSNLKAVDGSQYNFYAIGEAPNYFAGNIDCDGLINGAFSLRMQTDDPTAFQTTYSTDEEGNQVENQTYIGTTEDLLSIIKDLRARIEQLESNTLQPLYASLADLPSASDHHGKVAHVHSEGALYFAHAGNWVKLQNA